MSTSRAIGVSDIGFEFDVLIKGERTAGFDVFTAAHPDWTCRYGKNGGFLGEPPQLTPDEADAESFVALHLDAYAAQLSSLRALGHGHCVRIAVHVDCATITDFKLALKPSAMALVSALGYEVAFCVYPFAGHDDD